MRTIMIAVLIGIALFFGAIAVGSSLSTSVPQNSIAAQIGWR